MLPGCSHYMNTANVYYPSYDAYYGPRHSRTVPSTVLASMNPTWVERGPDGRPYFIRKKTNPPPVRELISSALQVRRNYSQPFTRAFRRDYSTVPVVSKDPTLLGLPPPQRPAQDERLGHISQSAQPVGPLLHSMFPLSQRGPPLQESTNRRQDHMLKAQIQQYLAAPNPRMYPIPSYLPQPTFLPQPMHFTHPPPSAHPIQATNPHGVYPAPPLPPGARLISPPRYATADDLKYKCRVCGRFRSSRYHYKHPIPAGQLPKETVCRKCREEATDSDDEDSNDSSYEKTHRQARSRSRSRCVELIEPVSRPGDRRGRPRSRSIVTAVEVAEAVGRRPMRSYDRLLAHVEGRSCSRASHDRRFVRSYSRSSSLDVRPLRIATEDDGYAFRRRSPSLEVIERVRYVHDLPHLPSFAEETTYIDEDGRRVRRFVYEDDHYDGDVEYNHPRRTREIPRPPTWMRRTSRRQPSQSVVRKPCSTERILCHDGPPSLAEQSTHLVRVSRPVSRSPSRDILDFPAPQCHPRIRHRISRGDKDQGNGGYDQGVSHQDSWYDDGSFRGTSHYRRRSRSRASSVVTHDTDELARRPSWLSRAPTPPPMVSSSSLGYIEAQPREEEVQVTRTMQHAAVDGHGRPTRLTRRRRSRSRSRSITESHPGGKLLRPGDHITVIESHRPSQGAVEDYDWYDKDGLRVRVREI